jgi:hypothetical protein
MLAFLDPRRRRRLLHLDALALLAFMVSFEFLAHGNLEPAVWLVYPPLMYLLARLLRLGFARRAPTGRLAPMLSMRTLLIGLPLILAARIALSLLGHQEIDVGYESVIGAFRILHHLPIYWGDPNHGDTYGLISMLSVLVLLTLASPLVSGTLLGLAAAAKFSPAGLLPLLAAPRQRGWRGAAICVVAFTGVVGLAIFAWLPPQGLGYFWQRTIGFQLHRLDVFSPWALHPGLHPVQVALEAGAVLLVAAVAFFPRERSLVRTCALAGAVTIAIQLPATHWFYYYIMWFLPFALVALLAPAAEAARATVDDAEAAGFSVADRRPQTEPVPVGV